MLPKSRINQSTTVVLSGGEVVIRGLTFAEICTVQGDEANAIAVALGTGVSLAEALEWIESPEVVAGDVQKLLDAVMNLSGLGEGAQKSE